MSEHSISASFAEGFSTEHVLNFQESAFQFQSPSSLSWFKTLIPQLPEPEKMTLQIRIAPSQAPQDTSSWGKFSDLGSAPSSDDIDAIRGEIWKGFADKDE